MDKMERKRQIENLKRLCNLNKEEYCDRIKGDTKRA